MVLNAIALIALRTSVQRSWPGVDSLVPEGESAAARSKHPIARAEFESSPHTRITILATGVINCAEIRIDDTQ